MKMSFFVVLFLLSSAAMGNPEGLKLGKIACEKATNSKRMFERKAKSIAEELRSISVVHLEKNSIATCTLRDDPMTDDGGERCTYECSVDVKHGTSVLRIHLYEDFSKRIRLLKLETLSSS